MDVAAIRRPFLRSTSAGRKGMVLAYVIPMVIACSAMQTWFQPGTFIAGGDIGPFVREDVEPQLQSGWDSSSAAGAPGYNVGSAPEVLTIQAARAVGADEETAQRIFYTIVVAGLVAGAVYLVSGLVPNSPFIAGGVGLLALFNSGFLQNSSILVMWATAFGAAAAGMIVRVAKDKAVSPIALGLLSMLGVYMAINPPLLVVTGVWIILFCILGDAIGGPGGASRSLRFIMRAAPWVLLLNLWWIVPLLFSLMSPGVGRDFVAETDIRSWSFTHRRSSITNVITLSSAWGWNDPQYFPHAAKLDQPVWGSLRFALPIVAFAAPLFGLKKRRPAAIGFTVAALLMVVISKGVHPPLGSMNLFLYEHVPGMWLLRDPSSKLIPLLMLLYLGMAAITIEGVTGQRIGDRPLLKDVPKIAAFSLLALALVYPYPVWNGEVVPEERPLLPSGHVTVPKDWEEVATFIDSSPASGKVLVLPLNDYYQIPTKWGYYGVDAFPRSFTDRPVIQFGPGGYFTALPRFARLVDAVERSLASPTTSGVPRLLQALGVSHIVLRHDIDRSFPGRSFADPQPIARGLRRTDGVEPALSTAVADVYRVGVDDPRLQTYAGAATGSLEPGNEGALLARLPDDVALVPNLAWESGRSLPTFPGDPRSEPPEMNWSQTGSARYEAQIEGAESDFLLALTESFSSGWQLSGLPPDRDIAHVEVDGYANGWVVEGGEPIRLTVTYGPDRWIRAAWVISFLVLLVALPMIISKSGRLPLLLRRRPSSS